MSSIGKGGGRLTSDRLASHPVGSSDTPSHLMLQRNDTLRSGSEDQSSSSSLLLLLATVSNACLFLFSLIGRELAWQFLQDNWDELYNRYASGLLLPRLVQVN